jgi:hypothetical protein
MQVQAHETGRLHVFAVNMPARLLDTRFNPPETGANRLQPDTGLLTDLTETGGLDPSGAELIPLKDLYGLGLSGYLTEGHDIPAEAIAPQKRRLDALEGYALLLGSRTFRGSPFRLGETASLTHIASFDLPGTDWSAAGPIPSEAARPYSAPGVSPRDARRRAQRLGGAIFAVFMVLIVLVLWILIA